jgi:signal transduction histidine kinase
MNEDLEERIALAQDELLIKERLATLGQLSGGISHELRSPLAAIQSAAELLKLQLDSSDSDSADALDKILTEVDRSVKTIESLLGFAKARSPKQENVNLNRLAQEIIQEIDIPTSIAIVTDFDLNMIDVITDSFQIKRALANIIINAIEAMPETGKLTLSTATENNGYISVTVSDTGPGLTEEQMSKLFRPLHTTKETGVGLGLTITRLLVEANGGKIEVESEPGAGTAFKIFLPKSN